MTFSIAATDPDTRAVGAAVASVFPSVGAVCPWVSEDVAVLTQAWDAGPSYGRPVLNMVADGLSLPTAVDALVNERSAGSGTQLHGVEANGRTAAYTSDRASTWAGHTVGQHHTVAGNTLVGRRVVTAMCESFVDAEGPLTKRLLTALDAGEAAGGDRRGDNLSAAVLVHTPEPKLYHNLRVDRPGDPIAGLWEGFQAAREYEDTPTDPDLVREAWGDDYPDGIAGYGLKY